MNTHKPTDPTLRAAIEALQQGDAAARATLFEPDARRYEEGGARSLQPYTREAVGHERFISIARLAIGQPSTDTRCIRYS